MAPLTTPPAGSSLTTQQIETAEALIASELNLLTLAEAEYTQQGTVGSSGTINLARPAESVTALALNGMPAAGVLSSPTILSLGALVGSATWGAGPARVTYAVRIRGGWTPNTLPEQVRQAVLLLAAQVAASAGREGVTSERMGPVARTYSDAVSAGSLPADALNLLRPWLPLRV